MSSGSKNEKKLFATISDRRLSASLAGLNELT